MKIVNRIRDALFGGSARCKPGDLAVYVGMETRCLGQTTTVLRRVPTPRKKGLFAPVEGVWWEVNPPIDGNAIEVADVALRPLRGDDLSQSDVDALYAAPKRTEVV